jgi:hypothetical protein
MYFFRAEFQQVIRRVASFKKGDIEISFANDMKTIAADTAAEKEVIELEMKEPIKLVSVAMSPKTWQETVLEIGESSAKAAILYAWTIVERELKTTAVRLGMPKSQSHIPAREIARWLESKSQSGKANLNPLVYRLSAVRNKLAHDIPERLISPHDLDVQIYLEGAETVIAALSLMVSQDSKDDINHQ